MEEERERKKEIKLGGGELWQSAGLTLTWQTCPSGLVDFFFPKKNK